MTNSYIRLNTKFLTSLIALLGAAAILFTSISAEAQESYKKHFSAYQAAHASGDMVTARQEAGAAWKAAEKDLGNDKLTGILAYNYGSIMILHTPEEAVKPLQRARQTP